MAIQLKGEKRSDIRVKFKLQQFNGQRVKGEEHSDIRLNFKLQQFHGHIVKGEERSDICPQMAARVPTEPSRLPFTKPIFFFFFFF